MFYKIIIFCSLLTQLLLSNTVLQSDSLRNAAKKQTGKELIGTYFELMKDSDISFEERAEFADDALTAANAISDSLLISRVLKEKAVLYYENQFYEESIRCFEKALSIAIRYDDLSLQSEIYYNLGFAYNMQKRNIEGTECLRKAIEINKKLDDLEAYGDALNGLGYIYWIISQFDSALYYFERGLEVRKEVQDTLKIGKSLNNIGIIYWHWAVYDKALEYYRQAIEMRRAAGDLRGTILVLNNIGVLYKELKYYDMCREYLIESLAESEKLDDHELHGYVKSNIGELYVELNQLDSAMVFFEDALEEYKMTNFPLNYVIVYNNMGDVFIKKNEFEKAKEVLKESVIITDSLDNFRLKAVALRLLGKAELCEGNLPLAKKYLLEAVELDTEINAKEDLRDTYIILTEVYKAMGDYREALHVHELYSSANDSIYTEEVEQRILDFKMRFEYEKNERLLQAKQYEIEQQTIVRNILIIAAVAMIAVIIFIFRINRSRLAANRKLKETNEQIKEQNDRINLQKKQLEEQKIELETINEQLESTNQELNILNSTKDKFFSIIAHDLKNPFNALIGISGLLISEYDEMEDEEILMFLSKIEKSSKFSFQLLENLLQWSRAQTGSLKHNPEKINLFELAEENISLVEGNAQNKNISLKNEVPQDALAFADKAMINTILRNLLTNAIKFTNEDGFVKIIAFDKQENLHVTVEDNGIGMTEDTISKLFRIDVNISGIGTNKERGTGLGMILCKEFIEKNNGEIWIESEPDKGTKIHFLIPKK